MLKFTTSNGTQWKVFGISFPSATIYQTLQRAIDANCLTQEYLQEITGYKSPITINLKDHIIDFERF